MHFYIAQWYRDTTVEAEKKIKAQQNTSGSDEEDFNETEAEKTTEVMQNVEKRKNFLLSRIAESNSSLATIATIRLVKKIFHHTIGFSVL